MRRFLAFLILVFVLNPAVVSPQTPDAASLLALHRQFMGWQFGDGTFTSERAQGTQTRSEPHEAARTAHVTELRLGPIYRDTYVDAQTDASTSQGFTGRVFWGSNDDGFTHPIFGQAQKYAISEQYFFNEGTTELTGALQGTARVGNLDCTIVRVTPDTGLPIDLYIDPTTGAYERVVIDPTGGYDSTFDDITYTQVLPGKRMMSGYKAADGRLVQTWSMITPNAPVTAEELHPPAQTAEWTFSNPRPFPVTITRFRVLVDATVNGVKGRFILDTGADGIYLDRGFAAQAHVTFTGSLNVSGAYDTTRVGTGVANIVVGDNTLSNVVVHDMSFTDYTYRGLDWENYAGLLGYPIFGGAVVTLRFSDSTMTIEDPSTADLSGVKAIPFAIDLSREMPLVSSVLNGTFGVDAILDTGNPGALLISPDLISKYHFPQPLGYCLQLRSLALGPIQYLSQGGCEDGILFDRQILAGFDLLKHFDITLDYSRGQMFLKPLSP